VAVVLVMSVVGACGSHAGAEGVPTVPDSTLRDPDNPYWQARPLNFDFVDPARGPGMR
jgi:hypothetical protein